MSLRLDRVFLTVVLSLSLGGLAAAAPPTLEQQVATLRARADRAAAAGKLEDAITWVNEAQKRVRAARRAALTPKPGKRSPEHEQERQKLREWLLSQEKLVRSGKKSQHQVARELKTRQEALARKYGREAGGPAPGMAIARFDLLSATLEDALHGYYRQKGNAREAAAHRRAALVARLQAYQAQNKQEEAAAVAAKLLTAVPEDPESYSAAGTYYQERGQYQRALDTWSRGIRALESGTATPRPTSTRGRANARNQYLTHFYRQQAYCYSRLGRAADARAAIEKAAKLEGSRRG